MSVVITRGHLCLLVSTTICIALVAVCVSVYLRWSGEGDDLTDLTWREYSKEAIAKCISNKQNALILVSADWTSTTSFPSTSTMLIDETNERLLQNYGVLKLRADVTESNASRNLQNDIFELTGEKNIGAPGIVLVPGDRVEDAFVVPVSVLRSEKLRHVIASTFHPLPLADTKQNEINTSVDPAGPAAESLKEIPKLVESLDSFIVMDDDRNGHLYIRIRLNDGIYVYSMTQQLIGTTPTTIDIETADRFEITGKSVSVFPPEITRSEEIWPDTDIEIHFDNATWVIPIHVLQKDPDNSLNIPSRVRFSANDGLTLNGVFDETVVANQSDPFGED